LYRRRLKARRKNILPGESGTFTGKELDAETGLYYYGARYLDPRTSRWISGDPALGEYIPGAPVDEEAKKRNQNLPGGGGIFNLVNLHMYHYAGNNPVKYVDPDGREDDLNDQLNKNITEYYFNGPTANNLGIKGFNNSSQKGSKLSEGMKDFLGKIWASPVTIAGFLFGLVSVGISRLAGKGGYIKIENNAITFTTGLKFGRNGGSVTLGNTIIHAGGDIGEWNSETITSRYDNNGMVNLGKHEEKHTYQYQESSIFFFADWLPSALSRGGIASSHLEKEADNYSEIPHKR
jgi:RHS repeat-associated protein